jgi:hypothetical protein
MLISIIVGKGHLMGVPDAIALIFMDNVIRGHDCRIAIGASSEFLGSVSLVHNQSTSIPVTETNTASRFTAGIDGPTGISRFVEPVEIISDTAAVAGTGVVIWVARSAAESKISSWLSTHLLYSSTVPVSVKFQLNVGISDGNQRDDCEKSKSSYFGSQA